jgi:tetratricopeptide (TPR) repeat protein
LNSELPPGSLPYFSTDDPEAFKNVIYGNNAFWKKDFSTAEKFFLQALTIDSNCVSASVMLSWVFQNLGLDVQGRKWCLMAYKKRELLSLQQKINVDILHAICLETPFEAIKYLKQYQVIDDNSPYNYYTLGWNYDQIYQFDNAIPEYEKALEIFRKWGTKPVWVYNYTQLGKDYHKNSKYKNEKDLYKKAEQDFPDDPDLIHNQAVLSLSEGDMGAANRYIEKYTSIRKKTSASDAFIENGIASIYSEAGILEKAEESYKKAITLSPKNSALKNNLAYFLIDKDRNINEGLQLVDSALKLRPDNYSYLHCKGWGLYKQGKYQESLDILQKSWDLRMKNAIYDHTAYLHLEAAKKAVANQKKN